MWFFASNGLFTIPGQNFIFWPRRALHSCSRKLYSASSPEVFLTAAHWPVIASSRGLGRLLFQQKSVSGEITKNKNPAYGNLDYRLPFSGNAEFDGIIRLQ